MELNWRCSEIETKKERVKKKNGIDSNWNENRRMHFLHSKKWGQAHTVSVCSLFLENVGMHFMEYVKRFYFELKTTCYIIYIQEMYVEKNKKTLSKSFYALFSLWMMYSIFYPLFFPLSSNSLIHTHLL